MVNPLWIFYGEQEKWNSQNKFLYSKASGVNISSAIQKMHLSRALQKYNCGALKNEDTKKVYKREFEDMEKKLLAYFELRIKIHKQDKCGVSFGILQAKLLKWAREAGISEDKFAASNGCITGVLKRNVKISINLYGEANDITDKAAAAMMNPWLKDVHK